MAIALASFTSGGTGGNATATLATTLPTGTANGDFLVLFVDLAGVNASTPSITTPSGYTQIVAGNSGSPASGFNIAMGVFYKVATASETAPSITATNVGGRMRYALHRYTGVNPSSPFTTGEASATFGTGSGNTTAHTIPSVTTNGVREIIVSAGDVQASSWTFPSGYTSVQNDTASNTSLASAYSTANAAAGTVSPGTFTSSVSSAVWFTTAIAINPAGSTAPTANTTVTSDIAIIDATSSTAGAGGTLTYAISPTTGTNQIISGVFVVPRGSADTNYTVTVTETGSGLTNTATAVSPAKAANTTTTVNTAIPKSPTGTGPTGTTWA